MSRQQFDLYTDIESAFETCKICDARMKSMRIEPCGHLLCKVCLQSWMEANGGRETLCPFCRQKVGSTVLHQVCAKWSLNTVSYFCRDGPAMADLRPKWLV